MLGRNSHNAFPLPSPRSRGMDGDANPGGMDQLTWFDVLSVMGKSSIIILKDIQSVFEYPFHLDTWSKWWSSIVTAAAASLDTKDNWATTAVLQQIAMIVLVYFVLASIYLEIRHHQKSIRTKIKKKVQSESVLFGGRRLMVRKPYQNGSPNSSALTTSMGPWMHTLKLNPEFVAKYCQTYKETDEEEDTPKGGGNETSNEASQEQEKTQESTSPSSSDSTGSKKQSNTSKCQIMSVGDYFASLQPVILDDPTIQKFVPTWIQKEIEAAITTLLLKALGPTVSAILVPMAIGKSSNTILRNPIVKRLSTKLSSAFPALPGKEATSQKQRRDEESSQNKGAKTHSDQHNVNTNATTTTTTTTTTTSADFLLYEGGIPLSLLTIPVISTVNKIATSINSDDNENNDNDTKGSNVTRDISPSSPPPSSSLDKMKLGEVGYELSFGDASSLVKGKNQIEKEAKQQRSKNNDYVSQTDETNKKEGTPLSQELLPMRLLDKQEDEHPNAIIWRQEPQEGKNSMPLGKKNGEENQALSTSSLPVEEEKNINDHNHIIDSSSSNVTSNNESHTNTYSGSNSTHHDDNTVEPSSSSPSTDVCHPMIPNPFCVAHHWDRALDNMVELLNHNDSGDSDDDESTRRTFFDPNDTSMSPPTPINERLLPDLYVGWGNSYCTHTKLQILENRLLACLLNRLAYNYTYLEKEDSSHHKHDDDDDGHNSDIHTNNDSDTANISNDKLFQVCLYRGDPLIDNPADFIKSLVKSGHHVQVCPRLQITTFGIGLCVKERNGSWTNLPLAFFLSSGFQDEVTGRGAMTCMPHGGIDLNITSGPLISQASIQHYVAIEGLCGWHSNHNPNVPWLRPTQCREEPWKGDRAVQAVRLAGLVAVVTNTLATELDLPFGGYGLIGVCNDSTAIVDQAMEGSTNVYPLTTSGSFAMVLLRRMRQLRSALAKYNNTNSKSISKRNVDVDIAGLDRLMFAMTQLGSDLNPSPAIAGDSARRLLHCLPNRLPFQLAVEAKELAEKIQKEHDEIVSLTSINNELLSATVKNSSRFKTPERKQRNFDNSRNADAGDSPCWNSIGLDSEGHIVFSP